MTVGQVLPSCFSTHIKFSETNVILILDLHQVFLLTSVLKCLQIVFMVRKCFITWFEGRKRHRYVCTYLANYFIEDKVVFMVVASAASTASFLQKNVFTFNNVLIFLYFINATVKNTMKLE